MEQQPEFQDVLASVKNLLSLNNRTFTNVAEKVAKTQGNLDEDRQAKEILAVMVEDGIENGTVGRAIAAVRQMLRRMGLLDGANYSEAEIKELLVRAARDIVSGAEAKQKALAAMPVQEQILKDPTTVADVLYNAINEVYASGVLMDRTVSLYESGNPAASEELYRAKIAPGAAPDMIDPEALYSVAYHGTAATFNQFDMNYVGSGEGAQAYGWGLYFSAKRGIAEWYQRNAARGKLTYSYGENHGLTGKEIQYQMEDALTNELLRQEIDIETANRVGPEVAAATLAMYRRHDGSLTAVKEELAQQRDNYLRKAQVAQRIRDDDIARGEDPGDVGVWGRLGAEGVIARDNATSEAYDRAIELVNRLSGEGLRANLMEVEVPDEQDLLRYDVPMGEQPDILSKIPEDIQDAIMAAHPNLSTSIMDMRGGQFYGYLGSYLHDRKNQPYQDNLAKVPADRDKAASLYLKSIGIPGHAFTGRTSDERNFVIYDDAAVEIQKVNDRVRGDFEYSSDYSLFSRLPSIMRIEDSMRSQQPAAAAQVPVGESPAAYWKIASEAGTRAFNEPKGSWEERYYTELGKQASQAARAAVPPPAQMTEQQALFSRDMSRREFLVGASAAVTSTAMTPSGIAAELFNEVIAPGPQNFDDYDAWLKSPGVKTVFEQMNINGQSYNVVAMNNTAYPGWNIRATNSDTLERIIKSDIPVGNSYADAITNIKRAVITPMSVAEQTKAGPRQQIDDVADAVEDEIERHVELQGTGLRGMRQPLFSRFVHPDPEMEDIRARRLSPALEDYTVKDRVRDLVNRVRGIEWLSVKQGIVDSAASVEEYEKGIFNRVLDASESAYKSILATRNLGSVMAAIMHRGIPMYQNGVFTPRAGRKGLIQIFEKITHHESGNLLPLWELYAAAKRASRLIQEKNYDGTSKEKNFTQDEISKALTLGVQYPEFQTAFLEWQKFNSQLLDLAIKRGVINGTEAKIWRQNDYVPFYRAMEEVEYRGGQGPQTGREGVANVRSGIKRLTGSENPIGNVFENMVMNTAYLTDAIYRNTSMQRIAAMLDGVAMHKVPMAFEAIRFSDTDLARALMKAGLIVGNGTTEADMFNDGIRQITAMTDAQKEHWSVLFRRVAPRGDNIVSVLEQGKPVYYEVSDPLLLRSIAAMGAQQAGGIMNTFRFAKRVLTRAVTVDPAFMMANFLRDTLSTAVIVKGSGGRQILGAIKGLRAAFNEDEEILEMMMAGAGGGGFYDHNPSDVRKMLAKKMPAGQVDAFRNSIITPRGLYRAWQKIGNASEQANRIALYKRVIAEGGTPAEAAFQARDVLNFTMSGDYNAMKFLVQTVPFLNARVQGLYRLWRGGKENPAGFAMKGGMIMAATIALLLRNQDDERYVELPEWDKDTYWHFYVGDEHLRLPKPFEVGALFATVPERAFMLSSGDDNIDTTIKRGWRMMMDTFAFNPIPQAIKPIIEQYSNRNMFTGNPIIGLAHKGLDPIAQYDPWTSETMREMAKVLPGWGGSPKRLEAFMRGYFGAVGMYALGASDAVTRRAFGHPERPTRGIRNYPVLTRFWRDPNPRTSKYASELYDMLGEADAIHKTMKAYRDQRRIGDAAAMMKENRGKLAARAFLHDVSGDVRKINNRIKQIQFSDMSGDKKKAAIDKLNAAKIKIMSRVTVVSDLF